MTKEFKSKELEYITASINMMSVTGTGKTREKYANDAMLMLKKVLADEGIKLEYSTKNLMGDK